MQYSVSIYFEAEYLFIQVFKDLYP